MTSLMSEAAVKVPPCSSWCTVDHMSEAEAFLNWERAENLPLVSKLQDDDGRIYCSHVFRVAGWTETFRIEQRHEADPEHPGAFRSSTAEILTPEWDGAWTREELAALVTEILPKVITVFDELTSAPRELLTNNR